MIFETTGKGTKTHKGVHTLFADIARRHPSLRSERAAALQRTYGHKHEADYGSRDAITAGDAQEALALAQDFIDASRAFLQSPCDG